ncbi:MAG: nucleotidyl transferase AbiEii/AbiGii toxin family protein [Candidatus Aminicenantes bacterium]|nr:nucleotidyl transferase AbiEii/AbiGii toxin family protein [Candidatus Aminicenantes bacterium]
MKEQIRQIIAETTNPLQARNRVREYLQARILQFVQEHGLFRNWIFHGGTALRFLYRLPRYSEDLDFSFNRRDKAMDFESAVSKVQPWFESEAYQVDLRINTDRVVKSASIGFPGLLHEMGLSPRRTQILSIKIELDSRPPLGGKTETSVIRRYMMLNILHYDKPSLLSGKLHALLSRPYIKGRDLYDIFWYLSEPSWPKPNIPFLNNALQQTGWPGPEIDQSHWTEVLAQKLKTIDWRRAVEDVLPFLERPEDIMMMTRENVLKLLKR